MRKLLDLYYTLAALKDWQDEVKRALATAEENEAKARKPKQAKVVDLAAYRALKASA